MNMARNDAFRVKTNAEMLAEILPAIEARAFALTLAGKPVLNDPHLIADRELAYSFGASIKDVVAAIRRGKGL